LDELPDLKEDPENLNDIARYTSLRTEEVCYALGWLGREGKLAAKKQGRVIKFSVV
jgi:hypothetical protein